MAGLAQQAEEKHEVAMWSRPPREARGAGAGFCGWGGTREATPPKEISTRPGAAHGKDENSVKATVYWVLCADQKLSA